MSLTIAQFTTIDERVEDRIAGIRERYEDAFEDLNRVTTALVLEAQSLRTGVQVGRDREAVLERLARIHDLADEARDAAYNLV